MDTRDVSKLRRLGLTTATEEGLEAVHVSAQLQQPLSGSRADLKAALQAWTGRLREILDRHGGEVLPESLSVTGQTVEALIPVTSLEQATRDLTASDVRLDLVMARNSLPPG